MRQIICSFYVSVLCVSKRKIPWSQKGDNKRTRAELVQFLTSLAKNDGQVQIREKEYLGHTLDSVIEGAFNEELIVSKVDADCPGFICIHITQKGLDKLELIAR